MAIHRLLEQELQTTAFGPDAIEAMHRAYEEACDDLGLSQKHNRVLELVALKIIEAAKTGERNVAALRGHALRALGLNPGAQ